MRLRAEEEGFPNTLLVHQGTPDEGMKFLTKRWPGARAVSDPDRRLYSAFGLARGSAGQLFGLPVWANAIKAVRFGVGVTKPVGDPLVLAGSFVVHGSHVLASDRAAHAGSIPDLTELSRIAKAHMPGAPA